ncbi:hypothetical protein BW425_07610 [Bacillus pseudomycoides]|uniref:Uncharacterized protein n=1 Tax=Bacillus pseudomycoides TaxID=64104 RepID=A0A1Y3MGS5_9BACI|nr:hypothetical protein BW425_07610 [Bacillus pseudomycoides]PEL31426.1 hypothetical protein CN608_07760 [Bacillus pseudomycoides]
MGERIWSGVETVGAFLSPMPCENRGRTEGEKEWGFPLVFKAAICTLEVKTIEIQIEKPIESLIFRWERMHRSGQILFLPHAKLKQKEKASRGHLLFFIAMTYTLENQNRYSFLNSEE